MDILMLLLLLPLAIPFITKWMFHYTITWKEMIAQTLIPVVLVFCVYQLGKYGQMSDVEIWNGEVVSKHRDHGTYLRSYSCHCTTNSDGNRRCQICYERHYTVDWYLETTVGRIGLAYLDRTSRSVYSAPDPEQYVRAYEGEACSVERSYVNYIKAVPESIFNFAQADTFDSFAPLIPQYPRVHDYYKINRVLDIGVNIPNIDQLNEHLSNHLRTIGHSKQANIIVIFVNTPNQMYRHALEKAWLGGKKNDIIVMIGTSNYPNIDWVDTITLGHNEGNSLLTVEMRDNIMALNTLEDGIRVIDVIADTVVQRFDRKPMEDYAYLKDEIEPPTWIIIFAFILGVGGSIGLSILFHRVDAFSSLS